MGKRNKGELSEVDKQIMQAVADESRPFTDPRAGYPFRGGLSQVAGRGEGAGRPAGSAVTPHPRDIAAQHVRALAATSDEGEADRLVAQLAALVSEALASLGGSAEDVAATLAAAGVRGYRNDRRDNPITRWLRAELGASDVVADEVLVVVCFALPDDGEQSVEDVEVPASVEEFFALFDEGGFPALVETGEGL